MQIFDEKFESMGLVDIKKINPNIIVDLKYATDENFTGKVLYTELSSAYCIPKIAYAISKAQSLLDKIKPGWHIVVWDAARPISIQKFMFNIVKGTDKEIYVANPYTTYEGGFHNYGMAVDVSLIDNASNEVDMGSAYDDFTILAHPGKEWELLRKGEMSLKAISNRLLLYYIMSESCMIAHPCEWWHYQFQYDESSKKNYKLLNF